MADSTPKKSPVRRIFEVLRFERAEISAIYFYAILSGLVQLSLPLGVQAIISFVLGGSISTSLVLLIACVIVGVFLNGLLQVNGMKLIERIQQQIFVRYAFSYAHAVPRLDLRAVDGYYLPELVNRFFDTATLQKGLAKLLLDVPLATIQIFFGLLLLSFYHPVFIFFGVVLLVALYTILRFTGGRGIQTSIEESNYKYGVAGFIQELARKVIPYKWARNPALHLRRADGLVSGYLGARTGHFRILLVQYWTLVGFKTLITAVMLVVGALLLVNQQLNVGQFIAAEIVILTVINSVEKLIVNLDNVYDVLTAVEKLGKVTDKPLEHSGDATAPHRAGFSLRVNDLTVRFSEAKAPVLDSIAFSVSAGEKVAVMGAPGSGRSTLLRVLAGLITPSSGALMLEDLPLHRYDTATLRARIGLALDGAEPVGGTLLENAGAGEDLGLAEVARLDALTEVLGLKPIIQSHPEGYGMTLAGEGIHLSPRTARQVALLRALMHTPALLILEEPWNELEPATAGRIQRYLLRETGGATVIVSTTDAAFARRCDKILVLDDGRLKAFGTPDSLAHLLNSPAGEGN